MNYKDIFELFFNNKDGPSWGKIIVLIIALIFIYYIYTLIKKH
jgi:hypothetical protein